MNEYEIYFINGHSLKYSYWKVSADSKDAALEKLGETFGAAFEHRLLLIKENGNTIFEY